MLWTWSCISNEHHWQQQQGSELGQWNISYNCAIIVVVRTSLFDCKASILTNWQHGDRRYCSFVLYTWLAYNTSIILIVIHCVHFTTSGDSLGPSSSLLLQLQWSDMLLLLQLLCPSCDWGAGPSRQCCWLRQAGRLGNTPTLVLYSECWWGDHAQDQGTCARLCLLCWCQLWGRVVGSS